MNRIARVLVVTMLVLTAAVGGGIYWQHVTKFRSTENAYVNANLVHIASQLDGPLLDVHVREGQFVQAGQPLFDIDPQSHEVALAEAKARLAQAERDALQAQAEANAHEAAVSQARVSLANAKAAALRTNRLVQQRFLPYQAEDDAQSRVEMAEAVLTHAYAKLAGAEARAVLIDDATPAIMAARAAVAQAELDLKRTRVVAAAEGWIVNLSLVPGTSVVAYRPLFAIVVRGSFWVDANFKETELPGIESGQPAELKIDMLPGQYYRGIVDVIEGGTGAAFSLLPPQNATGNWIKVTQRVPVRIRFVGEDADLPLRIGASAAVRVKVEN